jgi:hypothetical protein
MSVVTKPLPSYQQFLIVGFRGYESCTRCLAMPRLEHTYIYPFLLRYFGPLGRMPPFSLLMLFLILIQAGKRRKLNYTIHRKIVRPEHTYIRTYIHTYIHTFTFVDCKVFPNLCLITGRSAYTGHT